MSDVKWNDLVKVVLKYTEMGHQYVVLKRFNGHCQGNWEKVQTYHNKAPAMQKAHTVYESLTKEDEVIAR